LTDAEIELLEKEFKNRWSGEKKPMSNRDITAFRNYLIFELMLATSMRRGEVEGLRIKDTPDWLGENILFIYWSKFKQDRWAPLSNRLADLLRLYINNYRRLTLPRYVRRDDGDKPVFYSSQRHPLTGNGLYRNLVRAAQRAGIKKRINPHKLRHTWFTQNIEDIGISATQAIGGHKCIQTTEKYNHYVLCRKKNLGERLDRRRLPEAAQPGQRFMPYS
jgi:integrase